MREREMEMEMPPERHAEAPRATQSQPPPRATQSHPEEPRGTERHPEARGTQGQILEEHQRNTLGMSKEGQKEYLKNIQGIPKEYWRNA